MRIRFVCIILLIIAADVSRTQNLYDDAKMLELRLEFPQSNWRDMLQQNVQAERDIPAKLTVGATVMDSVGVRYKGNSSFNIPGDKKPFNITTDTYKDGQDLWGYTTFNLNNSFKDPTHVREIIAYRLAALYMPSAKAAFVKLFINNEYWGVYLHIQQLNRTFLRESFGNDEGNHYKGDPRGDMTWLGPDTARYRSNYELKTNKEKNDYSDLVGFIEKLNTLPQNRFATEIQAVINVDRALWYIAFCNLLVNLDSYIGSGHNYYFYHNPVDDRFSMIPWDLNEVLGTFSQQLSITDRERLSIFYNQQAPNRPLISKLLAVPEFKARYIAHFRTMMNEVFTQEFWQPRIQTYQNLIRTDVNADTKKLYSMQMFTDNVTMNVQTGGPVGGTIPGILSLINNRRAYLQTVPELNQQQAVIATPVHTPVKPTNDQPVHVSVDVSDAAQVYLWWNVDGKAFSRLFMRSTGNTYEADIPAQREGAVVRYYIEAFTAGNAASYKPERAEYETYSYTVSISIGQFPVVINEVMGSNSKTIKDPQGEYDDWIELHNTADTTVNLSGCYISANLANRHKWKIPNGTTLAGRAYLLIWIDDDTLDTPGLHANFKINKSGESVYLFDTDARGNVLLDSTIYISFKADTSWARSPNGVGQFINRRPTPMANNDIAAKVESESTPSSISIEVFPNPVTGSQVFVKLPIPPSGQMNIRLVDALGKVVRAVHNMEFVGGGTLTSVDVTNLPSGIYLIHVIDASTSLVKSVILLH